MANRLGL